MTRLNFIPEASRRAETRRRVLLRSGALLACVVIVMIAWIAFGREQHAVGALERQCVELRQALEKERRMTAEASLGQGRRRAEAARLALSRELRAPVPTTCVLAAVAEAMPSSIGLTTFSLDGSRSAAMGIELQGTAPDDVTIAKLIGRLDERALFRNVRLGYSQPTEGDELLGRRFQITADIPLSQHYVLVEPTHAQ